MMIRWCTNSPARSSTSFLQRVQQGAPGEGLVPGDRPPDAVLLVPVAHPRVATWLGGRAGLEEREKHLAGPAILLLHSLH